MPANKVQVTAADFDPSLLRFGEVRRYATTNQPYIPVLYRSDVLLLRTPTMPMPFGVSQPYNADESKADQKPTGDKSIALSFNNPSPEVAEFRAKLEQVDEMVLAEMVPRSEALFNKLKSKEVLDDNHYKSVTIPKKAEYGASLRVKWPKNEEPTFWDRDFQKRDEAFCTPGSTGSVIMELRPVYTVNGKFGVKWVIAQVLVESQPMTLTGCGFAPPAQEPQAQAFPQYVDEDE